MLLLHRRLPAAQVIAGITAALAAGSCSPDVVAVEARKHPAGPEPAGEPAWRLRRLRATEMRMRRKSLRKRDARARDPAVDAEHRRAAEATIEQLIARFGYCRECATDAATVLMRKRFHDLLG